ncbi:DEAD/DEAH box helicase [Alkalicella caledoniensis]|uniref:ATP-dependent RNA helicase CshA n=1 Tax=Alkalicella caledoniensis TaxID=2731377 RepID=A0A7G9WBG2_ALKCA|nr:DEAD/DEAH box helicase [Alkalicella caledoniensis]QNO16024.1 DEAD/DEAH box helicase [Alkalicella caledoniensis]
MKTFNDFELKGSILRAIQEMGFEEPTPIQGEAIPVVLEGRDLIGLAQTGTGKTAAFGLPMLNSFDPNSGFIQGLILCPTRELAIQVAEELGKLGKFTGNKILPIYGGQDIGRQIRALKQRPSIVVGTPGRVIDHINRKTLRIDQLKMAVLDEADEMLDMGFLEDIETILSETPLEKQTLLFSATMPKPIEKLADKFLQNPHRISVVPKQTTAPQIAQYYIELNEHQKFDALCRLLDIEGSTSAIIFGRTKRRVDQLADALNKRGYQAEGLHGDLSQAQRDTVMRKFRSNQVELLVATDVAARGLDVSGVTHVFNFDLPQNSDSYVHRIGRTGRAGNIGKAYTFATFREMGHLRYIESTVKTKIQKLPIPTSTQAIEGKQRIAVDKIVSLINDVDLTEYTGTAKSLIEEYDAVNLVAATIKLLSRETVETEINLTPEPPVHSKKNQGSGQKKSGYGKGRDNRDNRDRYRGQRREGAKSSKDSGGYKGKKDNRDYRGPKKK